MNELVLANRAADWRRLKMLVLDSVSSRLRKGYTTLVWTSFSSGSAESLGPDLPRQR